MMQQHIGGAGRVRTAIGPDHAVESEQGLDRVAFEPAVQPFPGRASEQIDQIALGGPVQRLDAQAQRPGGQSGAEAGQPQTRGQIGRGLQHLIAQHIGDRVQPAAIVIQPGGISRREPGHLPRSQAPLAYRQAVAVRQGQEVRHAALDHAQAVTGQLHVGDNLGIEQADGVAGGRVAIAGMEFLGDRRAADHGAALEHAHLQPGARHIPSADQAIMAPAQHHSIPHLARHPVRLPCHSCGEIETYRAVGIRSTGPRGPATSTRQSRMGEESGGDGGIRTLGTPYRVRRFSKPLPSATRPRLRQALSIAEAARVRNSLISGSDRLVR